MGTLLQDNTSGQDAGAVYVYRRDQDGPDQWGYFKKLTAADGAAFDQFGSVPGPEWRHPGRGGLVEEPVGRRRLCLPTPPGRDRQLGPGPETGGQ